MHHLFFRFARASSYAMGHPLAFVASVAFVILWLVTGPLFGFSDTWQLVINTLTTVVTFLMIFLVQHSQNHDTAALHAKLDELITHLSGPRDEIAGIEADEIPSATGPQGRSGSRQEATAAAPPPRGSAG